MPLNFDLNKYKADTTIFVETGTFRGDAINKALECEYEQIFTVEIDKKRHKWLVREFEDDDEVTFIRGNSEAEFPKIMDKIKEKCTIYLDAHYCGDDAEKGDKWSPIRDELNYLKTHSIKNHTIIIGDWICQNNTHKDEQSGLETGYMGHKNTLKKIKKINKKYKFSLETGSCEEDVLVAYIDE